MARVERDFMGLAVKQEPQETSDSAPIRDSAMQWSFPNKVSGPQFLSFKGTPEEKPKTGFESLASTGLVTITRTESYESVQKAYPGVMQKNMVIERPGGIRYTMSSYPAQHLDAQSILRPDVRVHSVTSQTNPRLSVAPLQPFFPASRQHLTPSKSQNLGEVPGTGMVPAIPAGTSVVGTTDLRTGSKSAVKAAQLTIFYNGSVCVYDDISPEKAQAIMLLAGNGPPPAPSTTPPAPVQAPAPRSSVFDGLAINRTHSFTPCSPNPISVASPNPISVASPNPISVASPSPISVASPSPISIASRSGSPSTGGSGSCNDITSAKPSGVISPPCTAEPSKAVSMLGSFPKTSSSCAVPQARKASLARFLERRKGRIINNSPYAKDQTSDAGAKASGGSTSFVISSSSPFPVQATS